MHVRNHVKELPPLITSQDLHELRQDITKVILPSGFTKISPEFGDISCGKLKADEWRSLLTVYLPLTVTKLWASSNHHRLHLKGLLALSIIVNIICSTTITEALIKCYNNAIRIYLKIIRAMNGCDLVTNHHMSLHLSLFMEQFGPCRTFWSFPYERLIGKLQRTLCTPSIGKEDIGK
jgi:hypothetical protein